MNFKEIVTKQYSLNDLFSKKTWLNNPSVNMYAAIQDESNELAVSAGWVPWWKGQEPSSDIPNCQVEVVDILHFHIGAALQEAQYELIGRRTEFEGDSLDEDSIEIFSDALTADSFDRNWKAGRDFTRYTEDERQFAIEEVANDLEVACSQEYKNPKLNVPYLDAVQSYLGAVLCYGARDSFGNFFELARAFDMSPDLIYWMYQAKHALNTFRKQNNYDGKDQTKPRYNKIWGGQEDNYHVMNHVRTMIENGTELTTEKLVEDIGNIYRAIGQQN